MIKLYSSIITALLFSFTLTSRVSLADTKPPIRFGSTLSLTGGAAAFGTACQNGVTLAVEDVNNGGGISGAPLEVLFEDFGDVDLKRAASAAQQFIGLRHVVALLPNWSEDAEVMGPIAESHGLIAMTLGAAGPRAARYSKSLFRATTSDSELAKQSTIDESAAGSKRACIFLADSNYYVDIGKELDESWKSRGGEIVSEQSLKYGETDVRTPVTKLRGVNCDTIFIWASPASIVPLIKEFRTQHIKGRRVLPWYATSDDILAAANGDDEPYSLYRYDLSDSAFILRYTEKFKTSPMRPAGNCYDGIRVLAKVMGSVGTDQSKVREALLGLKDYVGVTGPFRILPDRERVGEKIERVEVKGGKLNPAS